MQRARRSTSLLGRAPGSRLFPLSTPPGRRVLVEDPAHYLGELLRDRDGGQEHQVRGEGELLVAGRVHPVPVVEVGRDRVP